MLARWGLRKYQMNASQEPHWAGRAPAGGIDKHGGADIVLQRAVLHTGGSQLLKFQRLHVTSCALPAHFLRTPTEVH